MLRHAAKPSTRRIAVGARALSSNSLLKQRLIELMPEKQAALKKLKTEHGAKAAGPAPSETHRSRAPSRPPASL
jgi:hypothetical protein